MATSNWRISVPRRNSILTRSSGLRVPTKSVKEAKSDKRDADYQVAIEKCDALTGAAKDACVGNAKVRYGKS